VAYREPGSPKEIPGIPLNSLILPEGTWEHSTLLTEVDAAYQWRVLPSELGVCNPEDNLLYMITYLRVKRNMDSWIEKRRADELNPKR
jgi:hypothetical protein